MGTVTVLHFWHKLDTTAVDTAGSDRSTFKTNKQCFFFSFKYVEGRVSSKDESSTNTTAFRLVHGGTLFAATLDLAQKEDNLNVLY